ncbi:protein starmaker-like [Aphis gossypii]|uniref:Uncharacterized protein n=1 Tax=Aphis gossypii TaxID=80765 RepID=A0A9P0IYM4_APHGO|nr:protein starmaker-like [Aphis gossypii]CAH1716565.1 unnamed protein product [Aphis gossypii]
MKRMTVGCKLWLLVVVCVAFLYQDGPQGNGVLCAVKKHDSQSDEGSYPDVTDEDVDDDQDDDDGQNDSDDHSGNTSDGENSHGGTSDDDDGDTDVDDDDDEDHSESNYDKDESHGKNKNKHETNKKSHKGKRRQDHDDDDDGKDIEDDGFDGEAALDEDGEEDKQHCKKNKKSKKNVIAEMKITTTTTITGKPKDILKFLNNGVQPYKPAALDFKKKSSSNLLKEIEGILNKDSKPNKSKSRSKSKSKKESEEDLTEFIRNIVKEGIKKKSSKKMDKDKILITLVKSVLDVLKDSS